ncbi:MAG: type II restriction endonuclease [Bacilli bacterium]|nr:type II restriction endonuclease [Bacilli bacterium]
MRDFNEWLKTFRYSISGYDYYVNFEKVYRGVEKYKIELNILNSLIGSKNIEFDFEKIITKYPETLQCIPLLLAVRKNEIYAMDEDGEFYFNFKKRNYEIKHYKMFMRKTGLFNLISKHIINNLIDYALGVETGLDSNGRKNRGGHLMENLVERYLISTGVEYYKEMYLRDIESKFNIDLSALSNMGKTSKRFDFVVKTIKNIYAIETNFFSGGGGGSKINETARSYKMLATEAKEINNFVFVWITDGMAWNTAKGNLEETFDILETMYNIKDLENGILFELFK